MLLKLFTALLCLNLSILTSAENLPSVTTVLTAYSTTVADKCRTIMASTVVAGPIVTSVTKTVTLNRSPRRQKSTSFETVTFIPRAPTTTSTITSYVNSTVTPPVYLLTSISTITSRATIVAIITPPPITISNLTSTITSMKVDVSTIPAPSGWYPVSDTQDRVFPRSPIFTNTSKREAQRRMPAGEPNLRAKLYPKSVLCVRNTKIHTSLTSVFAGNTKTITATPSLVVIYTTRTITTTITLQQSTATTTLTTSTIEYATLSTTLPASTISLIDITTLIITTSTTSYAACYTPNLLGPILRHTSLEPAQHITNVVFSQIGVQSVNTLATNSAYECCVACVTTDGCAYGAWSVKVDTFPAVQHTCFGLFIGADGEGVCGKQSEQAGLFVHEPGLMDGYEMVVYNGCGFLWDGGLDMN